MFIHMILMVLGGVGLAVLGIRARIWDSKIRLLNSDGAAQAEMFHLVSRWGLRE